MQFKLKQPAAKMLPATANWGGWGEEEAKRGLGSRSGLMGREKRGPETGHELEGGKMAAYLLCPVGPTSQTTRLYPLCN